MKVALHSVGYSGVWGGEAVLTIGEFIRRARDLGFDGVELMGKRPHLSPLDFGSSELKTIREEIQSSGLELSCIASYHDFSNNLDHPDMAAMEKELVYLDSVLDMASELGCPLVRVYSGYRHPGVDFERQWNWCVEGLGEASDMAGNRSVTIGLQNHSSMASFAEEILELVKEVGSQNLRIVLDAPLLVERGEDIVESVRKCGDLIVHTHTSDYRYVYGRNPGDFFTFRRVMAVRMGTGIVDYPTFVRALKEIGFDGFLSYEMCCRLEGGPSEENLDELARGALEYSRKMIEEA
jgi:sugar phosphate isomerase/epimerase